MSTDAEVAAVNAERRFKPSKAQKIVLLTLKVVIGFLIVALIYRKVLPLIVGAPWAGVLSVASELTKRQVLLLAVIWFSGIWAYTYVLTAAMPRLTHRRALTLSLTGSAVSNLVPMGGALGIGLNYWMSRTWGFSKPAFALYTLVTNLWDVMAKLSLPALAIAGLLLTGDVTRPELAHAAAFALALLGMLMVFVLSALSSERAAGAIGRSMTPVVQGGYRLFRSKRVVDLESSVVEMRHESLNLLRTGWVQLSLGTVAYSALQLLLLYTSLRMLGTTLTMPEIFAGYALERVLTLVMITPGGTGFVELGMTALLIAFGGDPVTTVAGVLIYRAFTFGVEIPVGGVSLVLWLWHRRARGRSVELADAATRDDDAEGMVEVAA